MEIEIINQPYSEAYNEKIYDTDSPWNSEGWTWVKFTNDDTSEWCGKFRGFPGAVAVSKILNTILVLTSDYLFLLDGTNGDLLELEEQPLYYNLSTSPSGEFIVADFYNFFKVKQSLEDKELINSPIKMDMIEFNDWSGTILNFSCNEFTNSERHFKMGLDTETWTIKIISSNKS